jgi:hypothetical protein
MKWGTFHTITQQPASFHLITRQSSQSKNWPAPPTASAKDLRKLTQAFKNWTTFSKISKIRLLHFLFSPTMAILVLKLSRLLIHSTNENATKLQLRPSPPWRPNHRQGRRLDFRSFLRKSKRRLVHFCSRQPWRFWR